MEICSVCGRKNAARYEVKSEGKTLSLILCQSCYTRLYVNAENPLPTFFGAVPDSGKECPVCGTRLRDFKKTGMLGCAYCYKAFRNELRQAILYVQGNLTHEGKHPSEDAEEKYEQVRDLAYTQERLLERIAREERIGNQEELFRLRHELEAVNRKLNGGD